MADSVTTASPGTPYGEFLAELDEIQRLKWLSSELASADVGFESALNDWVLSHRSVWRAERNRVWSAPSPQSVER